MTSRERDTLDFIRSYQEANGGVSPSLDEIAAHLRLASRSTVHRYLTALERQRRISREHRCARSITILDHVDLSGVSDAAIAAEYARRFRGVLAA